MLKSEIKLMELRMPGVIAADGSISPFDAFKFIEKILAKAKTQQEVYDLAGLDRQFVGWLVTKAVSDALLTMAGDGKKANPRLRSHPRGNDRTNSNV